MFQYKIATIDIETFPNIGYAWDAISKYPDRRNLIDVEQPWVMASFAVKWEHEDGDPLGFKLPDFKKIYKNDPFDDSALIERMYDTLETANLITGHNIDFFDVRKINAKIAQAGLPPPVEPKTFDTMKEAKKHWLLPSYSLKAIAEFLGCPFNKLEHEGFPLWLKCMDGNEEAWGRFMEYNLQDVRVSQWVYHRTRAWSRSHPNITIFGNESNLCPVCGYKTKELEQPGALKKYLVERRRCLKKSCGKTSFGKPIRPEIEVLTS